jgi:carbonic anhydrase/acetyltransferase-like protein (isoleucine patch superfamily)
MPPFIHPLAYVSGDVTLDDGVFVLPFASIRGDTAPIRIGRDTNVQDGAVLHADEDTPCTVGARVTIGHRAIVHGCTVEDDALIGMGAIVLNNAVIGRGSLVGAGAVVREGMVVPPNSVVLGVPARVARELDAGVAERARHGVDVYCELRERHRRGEFPSMR